MLNNIVLLGRLTRDPELRSVSSGNPVCNFTLAVDRDRSADGEKVCDFIDCVAWNRTAEFVNKYFKKGSMLAVTGRLQQRKWTDKDGNTHNNHEVAVDTVYFA